MLFASIWKDYDKTGEDWYGSFNLSSLSCNTQLHGGFGQANFDILLPSQGAYFLYTKILGGHVEVRDRYYRTVYEGFISSVALADHTLRISCLGYYAKANDIIDDRIYPSGVVTLGDVVYDAAGLIDSWVANASWTDPADFDLMETDPETGAYLSLDFTDLKVRDALERCLAYGYSASDPQQAFLAIYESRYLRLFPGEVAGQNYDGFFISNHNVGGSNTSSLSLSEVRNKVFAIYANEGDGPSKTLAAEDAASQASYGTIEGVVQNGGNPEGLAMANTLRDAALEKFRWPGAAINVTVSGLVKTFAGELAQPYQIRAGDYVSFTDLDLGYSMKQSVAGQMGRRLSTFVVSTSYNAQSNTNNLTVGISDQEFEILMSRLGLSGGLR